MPKLFFSLFTTAAMGFAVSTAYGADFAVESPYVAPPEPESNYGLTADIWGGAFWLGNSEDDADDSDNGDGGALGGEASMLFGIGESAFIQLTAEGSHILLGDVDDDQFASGGQLSAHIVHGYGFGVFGGGGVAAFQDEDSANLWFIGGEYKHAFSYGNILLQAGYLDSEASGGSSTVTLNDAWFARIAPSFSFGNGLSLGLTAGHATGDIDGSSGGSVYSWGGSLGYDLQSAPVTAFVAYDGLLMDNGSDAQADEHEIKFGVRMALGGLASEQIDTPDIYRWVAIGQRAD